MATKNETQTPSQAQASERDKAQKIVDKAGDGWQVFHAKPATAAQAQGFGGGVAAMTVTPASYIAHKRLDATLLEMHGETPEQLAERIADWERGRPAAEPTQPTEEQILNSAKATLHMAITSDARPAIDVDVTVPSKKAEPKARRLRVNPPIEEVKLDKEDQALAGKQPPSTGVGTGTGQSAPAATP
jgi:hypothetical protein